MFGECHAHVIMDGKNYREAVDLHRNGVQDEVIHRVFRVCKEKGIRFIRDGGDALGVSERARLLAPLYGIDYRTPVFAIHKRGHYGSIVGKGFESLSEYHKLVLEARRRGADFVKIMTTGILDFRANGGVTGEMLSAGEVREMIHIAHEEGMAVMSHTNGARAVKIALEAGADSIEHGNYMDEEAIRMLAESPAVWVPTLVTVRNLLGCGRYEDEVLLPIMDSAAENLCLAYRLGAAVAAGSDAGAYQVLHGQGTVEEVEAFFRILGRGEEISAWMQKGEERIRARFCREEQ